MVWLPGTRSFRSFGTLKITALEAEAENVQCDTMSCRELVKVSRAQQKRNIRYASLG